MEGNSEHIYRLGSLEGFTPLQRLKIRLISGAFRSLIRVLGATLRCDSVEHLATPDENGRRPIFAIWHENVFPVLVVARGYRGLTMASKSRDGEYIARTLHGLGFGVVRGSSSRGGSAALIALIREVRGGATAVITVDGPRGPRRVAKGGVITLAAQSGIPIVPVYLEVERHWKLPTWDRLQIPVPFSRVRVRHGEPIAVPADASDELSAEKLAELQNKLDELSVAGLEPGKGPKG